MAEDSQTSAPSNYNRRSGKADVSAAVPTTPHNSEGVASKNSTPSIQADLIAKMTPQQPTGSAVEVQQLRDEMVQRQQRVMALELELASNASRLAQAEKA